MSSATGRDRPHGSTPSNENAPGSNRRRIHRQMVYKDKQFFVHPPHFSIVQPSRYQPINRKHVEAYHIRPQHGRNCMLNDDDVFVVIISFSPTSGRMQYAPTPVRLKSGLDWGMGGLRLRSLQGVCNTPLHLFG